MIEFCFETDVDLRNATKISDWISKGIQNEGFDEGDITYIFCTDEYLLELNRKYLKHNTLTDIISFDYSEDSLISGDIFISVERVKENANKFEISFDQELHRVMMHGVLHFCGFNDKEDSDKKVMRSKEDYYLSLRAF